MNYSEGQDQIEQDCERAIDVRGGSLCRLDGGGRGYCGYSWCPRRTDRVDTLRGEQP